MNIEKIFEPILTDALGRLQKRHKATAADTYRIFTPVFAAIARAAGTPKTIDLALDPSAVTEESLRALVREVFTPVVSAEDLVMMRRKTADLERELAQVRHPDRPAVGH